jgi:hypothetical protein|tara:strand:- start:56762 stop:57094 length:333 start_codon:yes stop_codon:yes gene_type:complete
MVDFKTHLFLVSFIVIFVLGFVALNESGKSLKIITSQSSLDIISYEETEKSLKDYLDSINQKGIIYSAIKESNIWKIKVQIDNDFTTYEIDAYSSEILCYENSNEKKCFN